MEIGRGLAPRDTTEVVKASRASHPSTVQKYRRQHYVFSPEKTVDEIDFLIDIHCFSGYSLSL